MDAAVLERAYEAFQEFHGYFAPVFGRKEARENSSHYLQALLVQSEERRNAENLSETVPASPRVQRFLSESPWDGRLQEYLSSRLKDSQGVWVLDGSDFPKQGMKSVGVVRQYCGALGKIANCQAGVRGRATPEEWTGDGERCATAGVPSHRREYRSKTELALDMLECAHQRTVGGWRFRFRDVADAAGGHRVRGMYYVLDVRPDMTVWPLEPMDRSALPGQRASPQTQCGGAAAHGRRSQALRRRHGGRSR